MRNLLLLPCFLLLLEFLSAQNAPGAFTGCGAETMMQHSPALISGRNKSDRKLQEAPSLAFSDGIRVLPVVVHIVHNNGPENISDAQVQQGIAQLNNAFSGLMGAGANTEIQFCLAQQDPAGLSTNGITRHVSALTNMVMETQDLDLKNTSRWAPGCYINIWLVASVSSLSSGPGVAGYAFFPSAHGSNMDGIVMEAPYFGSSQSNTSVLVHEMGHYFGLYHTFEGACPNNDCLADGDQVCDTPPDQSTFGSCMPNANSCNTDADDPGPNNPFSVDVPDMGENYMDYSDISCYNRFTPGQAVRMNWHLTQVRASLLACKSCQSPCLSPAVANIMLPASNVVILAGATQNFSGNLSQAVNPEWRLGPNTVFATGTTGSYTFNVPGTYWVYFLASSANPNICDAAIDSVKVTVECGAHAAFSTPNDQPDTGVQVPFTNDSQNAQTYQWFVDGVLVATTLHYTHNFSSNGIYTVMLTASNGICTDTVRHLIFVGCADESKRAAYWYFGEQAGLRFGSGSPVSLTDNAMVAPQGSSTMSDKSGNLLFYSNGLQVYNRNHTVMPNGNGLIGSDISAQSSLIVPMPGNSDRYYLFTTSNWLDPQRRLAYSVIDMTLNGGLGDVVAGMKNIVLNANVAEMVTAVVHKNCQDVWIVSHEVGNNRYVAYQLSPSGISNVPVVSATGNVYTGNNRSGSLRAAHNGKWLCAAFGGTAIPDGVTATIAHFNVATGVVSQVQTLETFGSMPNAFSSEFSLSDKVLYLCGFGNAVLHQYDLESPIIPLSVQTIPTGNSGANVLQMGPDGRIYVIFNTVPTLHVIEHPDVLGAGCGFTSNAVMLAGRNATLGFPNFLSHYFQPKLLFEGADTICQQEASALRINSSVCNATYTWSLYPVIGQITMQSDTSAQFVSDGTAGLTTIQLIRSTPCSQDTAWMNLFVKSCQVCPPLAIEAGKDTTLCAGQSAQLQATPGFVTYTWSPPTGLSNPNISNPLASPSVPTTYTVTGTAIGNEMILNGDFSQGNFGFGTEYIFSGAAVGHFWVTNNLTAINGAWNVPADHTPTPDGLMLVVDGDVTGATPVFWEQDVALPSNLDFTLRFWVAMAYFASPPVIRVEINGQIAGTFTPLGGQPWVGQWQPYSLNWNSGPMGTVHIALRDMNATYIGNDFAVDDISIRGICAYTDSITVHPLTVQAPVLDLGPDIVQCSNAVQKLDAGPGFLSYKWQDGSASQSFTAFGPGKYWVLVKDSCLGAQSDTIQILTAQSPTLDAGPERIICPGDSASLDFSGNATMNSYHWWPETGLSCSVCPYPKASPAQTTTYYLVGATVTGCTAFDSVRVRVLEPSIDSLQVSACGSYSYANTVFTASGIYLDTLQNYQGCDSVFQLNLTIYTSVSATQQRQICQGSSIQVGNSVYHSSGTYLDTLSTASGCDSIITTVLQVLAALHTAQQVALCQGESLTVGNHVYTNTGVYSDTLQSIGGCDSLVSSQVTVLPVWNLHHAVQICENDTFLVGNHAYTQSGTYTDSLQTLSGCDSIVTTALAVRPVVMSHLNFSICPGDSVVLGSKVYKSSGVYLDTLSSTTGCDSILNVSLMVHPAAPSQLSFSICQGDSLTLGAKVYKTSGIYLDTLASAAGCDSILHIALAVHPVVNSQLSFSICQGDSVTLGAKVYKTSGVYLDTLASAAGCDSILQIALAVHPAVTSQLSFSICQGDSVTLGAKVYKTSGVYLDTLASAVGCDSVLQVSLMVYSSVIRQFNLRVCQGDSVVLGSKVYKTSGTFVDTLTSATGCDSLLQLDLQVLPEMTAHQSIQICEGAHLQVGGHVYTETGNYTDLLQATGGCDSIVHTALTVHPGYKRQQGLVICQGESILVGNNIYLSSGEYVDSLQTQSGCDSILLTQLTVLDTSVLEQEFPWCPGDVVMVGTNHYVEPGTYRSVLQGINGCDSTVYTRLLPLGNNYCDSLRCSLYIPNAFAPGKDGPNQYFEAASNVSTVRELRIYDRWGELLYRGYDSEARWDGRFRGKEMPPGVYVYLIQGVCSDKRTFWKTGDLTLLR